LLCEHRLQFSVDEDPATGDAKPVGLRSIAECKSDADANLSSGQPSASASRCGSTPFPYAPFPLADALSELQPWPTGCAGPTSARDGEVPKRACLFAGYTTSRYYAVFARLPFASIITIL
jgi:hypothetical protein